MLSNGGVGIAGEDGQNFRAVYGAELGVTCAHRELVFAGRAPVAKVFDEFNAERFQWVPALNLSG